MDGKVYTSFEELSEQNRSLFRFFEKRGLGRLLRAVWDARQSEVEELHARIGALERELAGKVAVSLEREKGIEDLEARLSLLQTEWEMLESNREKQLKEFAGENHRLMTEGKKREMLCVKLEGLLAEKSRQSKELSERCECLERELAASRAHIRTQKSLNRQMSDELLRLAR